MPITINLLPWREIAREKIRKDFFKNLLICTVLALLCCIAISVVLNGQLSNQQSRNSYLISHIALLDEKINQIKNISIQREQLDFRMEVIQSLQSYRPMVVHVFDQLVQTLPKGVYYTSLKRKDQQLTISGMASANGQVSELMRKLNASSWLKNPELISIVENDQDQALKDFVLTVDINQLMHQQDERDL